MVDGETANKARESITQATTEMVTNPAAREIKVPERELTHCMPTRAKQAPAAQDAEASTAKMAPERGSDILKYY